MRSVKKVSPHSIHLIGRFGKVNNRRAWRSGKKYLRSYREKTQCRKRWPQKYLYATASVAAGRMRCRETSVPGRSLRRFSRCIFGCVTVGRKVRAANFRKVRRPRTQRRCLFRFWRTYAPRPTWRSVYCLDHPHVHFLSQTFLFPRHLRMHNPRMQIPCLRPIYAPPFFFATRALNAHLASGILCAGRPHQLH